MLFKDAIRKRRKLNSILNETRPHNVGSNQLYNLRGEIVRTVTGGPLLASLIGEGVNRKSGPIFLEL